MTPVDLDAARKAAREAQERAAKYMATLEATNTEEAENASYDEAMTAAYEFAQIVDSLSARVVPDLAALVLAMAEELERLTAQLSAEISSDTLVEVARERDTALADVTRQNAELADLRPIVLRAVEWAEGNGSSGRLVAALRAAGLLK